MSGVGGEGQGMVVTRQGKMSGRLWVDVDVDIVFVDDMVVVVFIDPVALVVDVFVSGDGSDETRKVERAALGGC